MAKRTVLTFESSSDIWPVVEKWAKDKGFREEGEAKSGETAGGKRRKFKRGSGLLMSSAHVEIGQEGKKVELSAWVKGYFAAELDLGRGLFGVLDRWTARRAVNDLLQALGQQPL